MSEGGRETRLQRGWLDRTLDPAVRAERGSCGLKQRERGGESGHETQPEDQGNDCQHVMALRRLVRVDAFGCFTAGGPEPCRKDEQNYALGSPEDSVA